MIKDKKLGLELPENEIERIWFGLKTKLQMEMKEFEDKIKPANRLKELHRLKNFIYINQELIKVCENHLKGGK